MAQSHVEPPPIHLINWTYGGKLEKDIVNLKLCRDPTSSTSDLYELRISFFDNGNPEEFLLFLHNFNTILAATGTLETVTKIQYLRTLVCGEALHQFDLLSSDMEMSETLNK